MCNLSFFVCVCYSPQWARASSFTRFLDNTQRRTTVGRTSLDGWSACRRDLYLTTHNTHNRQTSMPPGGIRAHNLNRRAAVDLRLRPRGHWDRHICILGDWNTGIKFCHCPNSLLPLTHKKAADLENVFHYCAVRSYGLASHPPHSGFGMYSWRDIGLVRVWEASVSFLQVFKWDWLQQLSLTF